MQRCILFYFLIQNTLASRNIPFQKRCSGKPEPKIQHWPQCMNSPKIVHSSNRSSFKHPVLTCLYGNWNILIAFTSYQNIQLLLKDFDDLQILYHFQLCSLRLSTIFLAEYYFWSSFQTSLKGCSAFSNSDFSKWIRIHLFSSLTIIILRRIVLRFFLSWRIDKNFAPTLQRIILQIRFGNLPTRFRPKAIANRDSLRWTQKVVFA
jgi:hypothetical protein